VSTPSGPADLLASARDLMSRTDASTVGVWPRTAALLARQALEDAMAERWKADQSTAPMTRATMRSQLTCLPAYVDEAVARQIAFAYAALSGACHYHSYELAPTAAELTRWIDAVEALIAELATTPCRCGPG
jgi:hypothetical protein